MPGIVPPDPRYAAIVDKRFNKRFRAQPDYVCEARFLDEVVHALQAAVDEGRRLVVTSGGHCLEGFVSEPDVKVILDISPMKRIYFDRVRHAIAVEAGTSVGDTVRVLSDRWGTMIPLGEYPGIGMGGHVVGGAFGFLCRQLGLAADYLYAVEVVTVDEAGKAVPVIATREKDDPLRELWWAHTGGGGGNFGVVTRYWFRSPDGPTDDPARMLPRAPESITTFTAEWSWDELDRESFLRLLENYGAWCEEQSSPGAGNTTLWTLFEGHRRQLGKTFIRGVSTAGAAAARQIEEYLAGLVNGTSLLAGPRLDHMSWLEFALNPFPDLFTGPPGGVSMKGKDALLKRRLTRSQLELVYDHLVRDDLDVMGGMFALATYGGQVNAVPPDATASAQRASIMDLACVSGWLDPKEEATNLRWVRDIYEGLFEETGGAPVPGERYEGALINHPDPDLADTSHNRSGIPWPTFYYLDNYPRLQRVKAKWDPRNVFRHAMSIQPAQD